MKKVLLMLLTLLVVAVTQGQTLNSGYYVFMNNADQTDDWPSQCIIRSLKGIGRPDEVVMYYNGFSKKLLRMGLGGIISEHQFPNMIAVNDMAVSPNGNLYLCGANKLTKRGMVCRIDIGSIEYAQTFTMDTVSFDKVKEFNDIEVFIERATGREAIVAIGQQNTTYDNDRIMCCLDDIFELGPTGNQSQGMYQVFKSSSGFNFIKLVTTDNYISLIHSKSFWNMGIATESFDDFYNDYNASTVNSSSPIPLFSTLYTYQHIITTTHLASQRVAATYIQGDEIAIATLAVSEGLHIPYAHVRTYDVSNGNMLESHSITMPSKSDPISLVYSIASDSLILTQAFDYNGDGNSCLNIAIPHNSSVGSYNTCPITTDWRVLSTETDDNNNFIYVWGNAIYLKNTQWCPAWTQNSYQTYQYQKPCYTYTNITVDDLPILQTIQGNGPICKFKSYANTSLDEIQVYPSADLSVAPDFSCVSILPWNDKSEIGQ